jgi:8-hydroxy-5-deazaflavin:NADPH oxidoreductase
MDVTIIGAGNMGRGIGTRLVGGGNRVKILGTDPEQARELAAELGGSAGQGGAAEGGATGETLSGDVVVLAVYYGSARSAVEQYGDQLDGKVLVEELFEKGNFEAADI